MDDKPIAVTIIKTYYCHDCPVTYLVKDSVGNVYEAPISELYYDLSQIYSPIVPQ